MQENLRHTCGHTCLGSPDCRLERLEPGKRGGRVLGLGVGDLRSRKWYLVVILLLYVGLITSFCLNISLLLRSYPAPPLQQARPDLPPAAPQPDGAGPEGGQVRREEWVYSTACLVEDPCEAGSYYSCPARTCLPCEPGSFQPVWGQTSCWPCPPNTTTDRAGAGSPAECKQRQCVHHSRPGLAILQSPNYPAQFPALASCHWRVAPAGPGPEPASVLLLLPALALPPACSHSLTVRRGGHQAPQSS